MNLDQIFFLSLNEYSYNDNFKIIELNLKLIEKSKVLSKFSVYFPNENAVREIFHEIYARVR
jgi:hypothetical protein